MRANFSHCFGDARAQTLTRQFEQAKGRDAANLNASAIFTHRFFKAVFHRSLVAMNFHVDEVDHHEASQIAQA